MHLAIENTDRAIVFADGKIIADESVYSVLSNDEIIEKANLEYGQNIKLSWTDYYGQYRILTFIIEYL